MSDREIAHRAEQMILCAIDVATKKNLPLTNSRDYQAAYRFHGLDGASSVFWDYRRNARGEISRYVYALDLIIIGDRTMTRNRVHDIGRKLCLPNVRIAETLDHAFQGYSLDDCSYKCSLGKLLHSVGNNIRANRNVSRYR